MKPTKRNNGNWWRFRFQEVAEKEAEERRALFYGEPKVPEKDS